MLTTPIQSPTTKEDLAYFLAVNKFNRLTLVENNLLDILGNLKTRKIRNGNLDIVNEVYKTNKANIVKLTHVLFVTDDNSHWLFTPPATVAFNQNASVRDNTLRRGSPYCIPRNVKKAFIIKSCTCTTLDDFLEAVVSRTIEAEELEL